MTRKEQIKLAAKLLEVSESQLSNWCYEIPEVPALYFSIPERGSGSLIVGNDGQILYADSSIGYKKHVEEYLNGTRTPLDG